MLYFAPRKAGSNWSGLNKRDVKELESQGRMEPPGEAAVAAAKADGSWSTLDDVENHIVPGRTSGPAADGHSALSAHVVC